jgi:hypothetical protein
VPRNSPGSEEGLSHKYLPSCQVSPDFFSLARFYNR